MICMPHNEVVDEEVSNHSPCQYTVEVTRVFKGTLEVYYYVCIAVCMCACHRVTTIHFQCDIYH